MPSNLAVIHELIARRLYDDAFVQAHVAGMK